MTFKKVFFTFALSICSANSFATHSLTNKIGGAFQAQAQAQPVSRNNNGSVLSMSVSEAEALLAKARALREQAAADEHKLHSTLIEKKNCKNVEIDTVIQSLFPLQHGANADYDIISLAARMEGLKISSRMYEKVVERLHEREIAARGLDHVESSHQHPEQVEFIRVAEPQAEELALVEGLIQHLIDGAEILDEKYLKNDQQKNHHHVDASHWSSGSLSKVLKEKAHFLGREHDEEFKKRLAEFYEAARKKHDHESYEML